MSKKKLTEAIHHLSRWPIISKEEIAEFDQEVIDWRLDFDPKYYDQFDKIAAELRIVALEFGKANKAYLKIDNKCLDKVKDLLKSVKSV